jgi:predicted negative regulator of RcsB-dependent stress response
MEQSLDKKPESKDIIKSFFTENKKKVFLFTSILVAMIIVFFLWKDNNYKKNILISEKYTKAQLLLSKNEKEAAAKHYEEIIFSKNEFYSVLALNTIMEKELIKDEKKILEFFNIIENLSHKESHIDLIHFKKALYLFKESKFDEANKLLKKLIEKESSLKIIAQEILIK